MHTAGDSRPRELVFKIIDNGHARLLGAGHILPKAALIEKIYRRCALPSFGGSACRGLVRIYQ